jgi:hypothetical protein
MRRFYLCWLLLFIPLVCLSQKGTTTVGIQIKPIFPVSFLGTGKIINDTGGVHFETILNSGFSAGMVVRHNFTGLLAFETGINYVKRKYSISFSETDFNGQTSFRIIGYEIPALLMIYAQLGEKIYINGAMGPVLDIFASSVQTFDYYYYNVAIRNHTAQPSLSANLGFEYRMEKSGILYLGTSFLRPFTYIYLSKLGYYRDGKSIIIQNELSGSYLTIDIRYFFPETKRKGTPME